MNVSSWLEKSVTALGITPDSGGLGPQLLIYEYHIDLMWVQVHFSKYDMIAYKRKHTSEYSFIRKYSSPILSYVVLLYCALVPRHWPQGLQEVSVRRGRDSSGLEAAGSGGLQPTCCRTWLGPSARMEVLQENN